MHINGLMSNLIKKSWTVSNIQASQSADLGDTQFLIGSQNTWDTQFLAESLEDARFFRDTRFLIFLGKKIMPIHFIEYEVF